MLNYCIPYINKKVSKERNLGINYSEKRINSLLHKELFVSFKIYDFLKLPMCSRHGLQEKLNNLPKTIKIKNKRIRLFHIFKLS